MNEAIALLFDEFATSYRQGANPDVRMYLERAGGDREALADLIDRFLQAVPAREPTEEEVVLVRARLESEPPLLVLRVQRKLTRSAVVDALMKSLGLDPDKRDKVAGYYHELEVGALDPKPVNSRVWDALGGFLQANVRVLAGLRPPPVAAAEAFHREADYLASWDEVPNPRFTEPRRRRYRTSKPPRVEQPAVEPERDEVDRLFTGNA